MKKIGEKCINQKGITLMALVVTIVILIILAVISINAIFGENGLIKNSQLAKQEHEKAFAREQLELVLADAFTEKHVNTKYNQDEFLDEFVKNKTQERGETIGDIAIYDGYAFELDRSVPQLGKYVGKRDELVFPEVTASSSNAEDKKTSTITIKAKEATNGINKIEILQDGFVIKEYTYDNVKDEIIENYEINKNGKYNIKVYAKLTASATVTVEGLIIPVTYTPNGDTTYKKEHRVIISASEEAEKIESIKYQWTQTTVEPAENTFTETCNNGDTITKNGITGKWYLWTLLETESGTKVIGRSEVFNFDNQGPEVTLTSTPISETSFKLDATAKDAESGIQKYEFYINDESKNTQETSNTSASFNVSGVSTGNSNCYVIVTDSLGNKTKKTVIARTKMYTWEKWSVNAITKYALNIGKFYGQCTFKTYDNTIKCAIFNSNTGKFDLKEGDQLWHTNGWLNFYGRVFYSCTYGTTGVSACEKKTYTNLFSPDIKSDTTYSKGTQQYSDVTSTSSSAYPTNGQSGSYWYVYVGIK